MLHFGVASVRSGLGGRWGWYDRTILWIGRVSGDRCEHWHRASRRISVWLDLHSGCPPKGDTRIRTLVVPAEPAIPRDIRILVQPGGDRIRCDRPAPGFGLS